MFRRIIIMVMALMIATNANAESIVDFIISNNPELKEIKTINRNILKLLKVEAKGTASYGHYTISEETSTLDKTKTRYDVRITASIPLLSPTEFAQRRIDEAHKERTLRLEVAELIKNYKAEQKAIEEENRILINLYNELQWMGKRVEAGVDSQKEYNQKLHDYLTKRKDYELKKEQVSYMLDKILSYVSADKRERLKGMLNGQNISQN